MCFPRNHQKELAKIARYQKGACELDSALKNIAEELEKLSINTKKIEESCATLVIGFRKKASEQRIFYSFSLTLFFLQYEEATEEWEQKKEVLKNKTEALKNYTADIMDRPAGIKAKTQAEALPLSVRETFRHVRNLKDSYDKRGKFTRISKPGDTS